MDDATRVQFFYLGDSEKLCPDMRRLISQEEIQCELFANTEDVHLALQDKQCHILVIDADTDDIDAIEVLHLVKKRYPTLQVFIASGKGEIAFAVRALKAGASDFIERPCNHTTVVPIIIQALDNIKRADRYYGKTLTNAERNVLAHIMQGYSNKEIAALQHRSVRTIEDHRNRVMRKLDAHNAVELVKAAMKIGY